MSLEEYRSKRDFRKTSEPKGSDKAEKDQLRFVIQRHQASHLHYDLRLEMGGTLKSWAVPKGPSMNHSDKRLAIQTEDHPVEYLTFEGTIPKGNYGAGHMQIWDSGTYTSANDSKPQAGWHKGDLKIIFNGDKLKGEFALVKTNRGEKDNQWLLIKKKDKAATKLDYDAEDFVNRVDESESEGELESEEGKVIDLNEMLKPMLATSSKNVVESAGWLYEIKWDGYRALANVNNGKVHLYSRNGITFNSRFSPIAESLKTLSHQAILDGEIVLLNEDGLPNFQGLQNYDPSNGQTLRYYVFDLLYLNGHSITRLPLTDRKSLIPDLIEDLELVFYCEHVEEEVQTFYEESVELGLEGIIAKKKDSHYHPGFRSENWLKVKANETTETLVCGYTESDRQTHFGSLILGVHKNGKLVYTGNCGSGFDAEGRKEIFEKMKPLQRKTCPFEGKINLKGRKPHWVKPELIAEVKFSERTSEGRLRHPVFKGLREDKEVKEIHLQGDKTVEVSNSNSSSTTETLEVEGVKVPFSNLEKVYWPDEGLRKYDLIDYYLKMAEVMMPYLKDRPQNLHRHPNGINGKSFYHKDTGEIMPHWIETVKYHSESAEKNIEYLLCQDEPTLLYMAQLGCIEINPWNSRTTSIDRPDYGVIDLDPSKGNSFQQVVETALIAKEVLDLAGIPGFCKTSGSSGLHIYIPLGAKYDYDDARDFVKLLCHLVHQKLPDLTSLERSLKKRKGKIYLDYLQNRRGQTLAAPYCLRPHAGATVSAPLSWDEVSTNLDRRDFNIHSMPKRVEEKGDLFQGVLGEGEDIEKALERLG